MTARGLEERDDQRGDLLVTGGRLLTPGGVVDGDLLVTGGRIAALGGSARERAAPGTPALDAAGGLVCPGFQDSHVHPHHAGLTLLACDLEGTADAQRYARVVADYAATRPDTGDGGWVTGGGWSMEAFPGGVPTAAALDAVLPDRPAFLPNRDGHGAWVNTRALQLAGITRHTPDPRDGRIERDGDGEPVGMLQEGAAALVGRLVPPPGEEVMDAALLAAQERMLAWGVTAWQDAMVGASGAVPDPLPSYRRLAASGQLRATVVGALWWDRGRGLEQVPELLERRDAARSGRFRATSVKIMQDGVAENFTAGMLEPYLDACGCPTSNAGHSFVDPALLAEAVAALHAAGVQVHVHALGDRAVREALDAVEAAQRAHPGRDLRHHLAHLQVVHPDDVPRFAALGVAANIQPLWAVHEPQMDELTIPFLGQRRAGWQYPFADLARSGAVLAAGSDWPVSTADVLQGLHVAVNRRTDPGHPPFLPHQALTTAQGLAAYTSGVAHVNHDEHRSGTLEVGRDGDLTILDRDLLAAPADEIREARVAATVIAGAVLHEAGAA